MKHQSSNFQALTVATQAATACIELANHVQRPFGDVVSQLQWAALSIPMLQLWRHRKFRTEWDGNKIRMSWKKAFQDFFIDFTMRYPSKMLSKADLSACNLGCRQLVLVI